MNKPLHILYIPGLGDEKGATAQARAVSLWRLYGVEAELIRMNWRDKKPWESKFKKLLDRIDELIEDGKLIGLVGASAGASAALNAFAARQQHIVGAVLIAGKVNRPEALGHIHYIENPALPESVVQVAHSLELLNTTKRAHILSRFGLYDGYVKRADSLVEGAHNQLVLTLGHSITIAFALTFGAPSLIRFLRHQAKSVI